MLRRGSLWAASFGMARRGQSGLGGHVAVRLGRIGFGWASCGKAVEARSGLSGCVGVCCVMLGQGGQGTAGSDKVSSVRARRSRYGGASYVVSRLVKARRLRRGMMSHGSFRRGAVS
jgi:hypothetical protein